MKKMERAVWFFLAMIILIPCSEAKAEYGDIRNWSLDKQRICDDVGRSLDYAGPLSTYNCRNSSVAMIEMDLGYVIGGVSEKLGDLDDYLTGRTPIRDRYGYIHGFKLKSVYQGRDKNLQSDVSKANALESADHGNSAQNANPSLR